MKTTIDIADPLFQQAKQIASQRSSTFKEIVETALRRFLEHEKNRDASFRLRDASVDGEGLQPGVQKGNWDQVYEGRGG